MLTPTGPGTRGHTAGAQGSERPAGQRPRRDTGTRPARGSREARVRERGALLLRRGQLQEPSRLTDRPPGPALPGTPPGLPAPLLALREGQATAFSVATLLRSGRLV